MPVPLEHYRVFYTVAQLHNMTAAARVLFLSQPSVSRYIQQLEQELGCRLFVRSKSGVRTTPEADKLYQRLEAAFEQIGKAEEELRSEQMLKSGAVRIGASEMTLHHYLLPYLRKFRQEYPDVHMKIANVTTPQAVAALRDNQIDFAIVIGAKTEGPDLEQRALQSFRDMVIAGPAFLALKGKPISVKELTAYPLVCLEKHTTSRWFWEQIFLQNGALLQPNIELATTDLIVPLVKNDLGIGFVPGEFARPYLEAGEIFEVELIQEVPSREICFLRDGRRPLSAAGQAFLNMLEDSGKKPCAGRENMLK